MMLIHRNYFVSYLAVAMKLPVVVIAGNRRCLNHALLTVRSILGHGLRCLGLVMNNPQETDDIAALTNADILTKVLDVPLLCGLGENLTQLPTDWRLMLNPIIRPMACRGDTGLSKN